MTVRACACSPSGWSGALPIIEAAGWAHVRRKFFDLARLQKSPLAAEAVKRTDVLFAIEAEINGQSSLHRLAARYEPSRPLASQLEAWMRENYQETLAQSY